MRYLTATLGAIFIYAGVILIGLAVTAFVPRLQQPFTVPLGILTFSAPLPILVALAAALPAAMHSFRSTLRRYAEKAEKSRPNQIDLPLSS